MIHNLKIKACYYDAIKEGKKTFEIRNNDRGFNAGDTVMLNKLSDCGNYESFYKITAEIGYVTNFEQKDNMVVFSLLNVREE